MIEDNFEMKKQPLNSGLELPSPNMDFRDIRQDYGGLYYVPTQFMPLTMMSLRPWPMQERTGNQFVAVVGEHGEFDGN